MELNRKTKMVEVAKMNEAERAMAAKIDKLVSTGDLEDDAHRGCGGGGGGGCFPFLWRSGGRRRLAQAPGLEVAVFGQGASSGTANANARLEKAAEQMANHADQLYAKASASRAKAKALFDLGKKQEAMAALRRAKALEKQAEVAASTHSAIEQQKDMLESSALQREIASALSASIATTKKKTKGLLEKAESAADDSAELRDQVDDISEVMGGLAKVDDYDDDDLLAELEGLASVPEGVEAPEVATAVADVAPAAIVVGIDPGLYPKAPRRGEHRQKLLSADSAAESAA
jgi:hypothetical protein